MVMMECVVEKLRKGIHCGMTDPLETVRREGRNVGNRERNQGEEGYEVFYGRTRGVTEMAAPKNTARLLQ